MANVYGSNGNRWWVGQNVGGSAMEKTVFGSNAIVPVGIAPGTPPAGYESLPSGNAADDAKFAAAAKSHAAKVVVEGITWAHINGPFTTQAAANAAIPGIQAKTPAAGEGQQVASNAGATLANITGGITGFSGTNFVLRALKIVVGGVLVIVGISKLTGTTNAVTKAVSKVPIVPL
jgi:hypothetical protein